MSAPARCCPLFTGPLWTQHGLLSSRSVWSRTPSALRSSATRDQSAGRHKADAGVEWKSRLLGRNLWSQPWPRPPPSKDTVRSDPVNEGPSTRQARPVSLSPDAALPATIEPCARAGPALKTDSRSAPSVVRHGGRSSRYGGPLALLSVRHRGEDVWPLSIACEGGGNV